jgi:aminopeptidase YwaD
VRERIDEHLRVLVDDIGARPPGSPANRRATGYVEQVLTAAGLEVRTFPFTTRWWEPGPGKLVTVDGAVEVAPNPYSPACEAEGRIVRIATLADLESFAATAHPDTMLVIEGHLTREQIMPGCFPFYDPEGHRRTVAALQAARPAAIIAVTDHWEPIFEDPDLGLPSTTVPIRVAAGWRDGDRVGLTLGGQVHQGDGATVTGRTGGGGRRIVLSAHLDSKVTTPGAFDNAGSVAVLLALAEVGLPEGAVVEVVPFNGEDHADACGEVAWLAANDLAEVAANVNLDGVGLLGRGTSIATLACSPGLEAAVARFVAERPGWVRADPWFESDHAVFAMQGIPALALTSEDVHALLGELAHTPADTRDVVDLDTLVEVADGVRALVPLVADHLATGAEMPTGTLPDHPRAPARIL